jgi:hypothetical protein
MMLVRKDETMTDEYVPTDEIVRVQYIGEDEHGVYGAMFDRWLAAHDAGKDAVIAAQAAAIDTALAAFPAENIRPLGPHEARAVKILRSAPSVSLDAVKAEARREADAEIQRLSGIIRAARSYTQSRQWWGERYDQRPLPEHNLLELHRLLDEIDDGNLKENSRVRALRSGGQS